MNDYKELRDALAADFGDGPWWDAPGLGAPRILCGADDRRYIAACDPVTIRQLLADLDAARADAARLDYLDQQHAALNAHYGTDYRWKLILSPNVVRLHLRGLDLNDANHRGEKNVRAAIDAVMKDRPPQPPVGT